MNRWPFMPANARRAVGICFDDEQLHWVEVDWPRRHQPRVVRHGLFERKLVQRRRDWQRHWRLEGVRARRTGLALNEQSVIRLRVPLPAGLRRAEQWFLLEQSLQAQLPWPLSETAWDCQLGSEALSTADAQPMQWVDVIATPKSEIRHHRVWCRRAGLRLMRVEPLLQARARGARWPQAWGDSTLADPHVAEVALGLALGAIQT